MELGALADNAVVQGAAVDVVRQREATRLRRVLKLAWILVPLVIYLWHRVLIGDPVHFGLPRLTETEIQNLPIIMLGIVLLPALVLPLMLAGRSPHVRFAPSEISVAFDDVVGLGVVRDEVVKTLNLFLAHQTFRERMGGNPRKAILFEGPPGTGKTYMAKAMAREAGVPFLFVSSSAFQSMYYGQTNRKIRSYFRALRKAAREEEVERLHDLVAHDAEPDDVVERDRDLARLELHVRRAPGTEERHDDHAAEQDDQQHRHQQRDLVLGEVRAPEADRVVDEDPVPEVDDDRDEAPGELGHPADPAGLPLPDDVDRGAPYDGIVRQRAQFHP